MPSNLFNYPFQPILNSTAPAFSSSFDDTALLVVLESTAIPRQWQHVGGRSIRFAESSGVDYYAKLGTSDVVAASSDSAKILGGTVEVWRVQPNQTHISLYSSTLAIVNITLGVGQ